MNSDPNYYCLPHIHDKPWTWDDDRADQVEEVKQKKWYEEESEDE